MRTDSTRVSDDALTELRGFVAERYGKEYLPGSPNVYKDQEGRPGRPRSRPPHFGSPYP